MTTYLTGESFPREVKVLRRHSMWQRIASHIRECHIKEKHQKNIKHVEALIQANPSIEQANPSFVKAQGHDLRSSQTLPTGFLGYGFSKSGLAQV